MSTIYDFLSDHNIPYEKFDHPAVSTCEEAKRLCPEMPGTPTKNLFLRDKDGKRHFLVVVEHEKNIDLKKLKELLGISKLSFASADSLKKYLGVEPGSVTLLGLIHDRDHGVEIIIDEALIEKSFQCHPLINMATLVIRYENIQRFLAITGHSLQHMILPERLS